MLAFQQIVSGLATGAIYATLGLSIVIINRATGVVNFAQGQLAVLSAYIAVSLMDMGYPALLAVLLAVAASVPLGAAIERWVMRRVAGEPGLIGVVVTIGLLLLLNGITGLVWTQEIRDFPSLFPRGILRILGAALSYDSVGIIAVLGLLATGLHLLFSHTRLGLALRAAADNPESSSLAGLNVNALLMVGWGLAAGVGAVAGCLVAPKVYLEPNMMQQILVYALVATVIGGLDSPGGVIAAAAGIGIVENLGGTYIPLIGNDLQIALPMLLMFAVLVFRPQGLFGRAVRRRV